MFDHFQNTTNSTDLGTTEMKDDIDSNTVHLNDIELSSFFKCSDDGGEALYAAVKEFLNVSNYIDIQKSCLGLSRFCLT